jgi:hypothetical protein
MEETKIQLSEREMNLLCDKEIILTKNKAIEKIKRLLENLQNRFQSYVDANPKLAQNEIFNTHPKISKGENYLGLPYLILDYPRCFQHQNIFTIRTMFWWGNFYSTTLHLAGKFKIEFTNKIENGFAFLSTTNYHIGINPNPWVHHFEKDNYQKINELKREDFIQISKEHQHLKLAVCISINSGELEDKLTSQWIELLRICFP